MVQLHPTAAKDLLSRTGSTGRTHPVCRPLLVCKELWLAVLLQSERRPVFANVHINVSSCLTVLGGSAHAGVYCTLCYPPTTFCFVGVGISRETNNMYVMFIINQEVFIRCYLCRDMANSRG